MKIILLTFHFLYGKLPCKDGLISVVPVLNLSFDLWIVKK